MANTIDFGVQFKVLNENLTSTSKQINEQLTQVNNNLKQVSENTNNFSLKLKSAVSVTALAISSLAATSGALNNTSKATQGLSLAFDSIGKGALNIPILLKSITDTMAKGNRTLVGFVSNQAILSTGFLGLSLALDEFDNGLLKTLSNIALLASILTGTLAVAVTRLTIFVGDLAFNLGSKLVESTIAATEKFIEYNRSVFIFTRTIEAFNSSLDGTVGSSEEWAKVINSLSKETGFLEKSLRDATTELVSTLGPIGFNQEQLLKLLQITTDYAAQVDGDAKQAVIDFVSALNGNSQAVFKYGVKLTAATVKQALYEKGVEKSFTAMNEHEKIQARFNILLDKYKPIAGAAAAIAGTFAGQQKVLEANTARLNQSFGKGAAIIENINIVTFLYNKVLGSLGEEVVAVVGFITALGARILQIGGFLLKWSLTIGLVIKGLQILKLLLSSDIARTAFVAGINLINKGLLLFTTYTGIATTSVNVMNVSLSGLASSALLATKRFGSMTLAMVSFSSVLGLARNAALLFGSAISTAFKFLLTNPVILLITALVSQLILIGQAFATVESKTGAISRTFGILFGIIGDLIKSIPIIGDIFSFLADSASSAFSVIKDFFSDFKNNLVIGAIAIVEGLLDAIDLLPDFFVSADKRISLKNAKKELNSLYASIKNVSYGTRNLASTSGEHVKRFIDTFDVEDVRKGIEDLTKDLKDVGKTQLQINRDLFTERINLINKAKIAEPKKWEELESLKAKVTLDYELKRTKIVKDEAEKRQKEEKERLDKIKENAKKVIDDLSDLFKNPIKIFFQDNLASVKEAAIAAAGIINSIFTSGLTSESSLSETLSSNLASIQAAYDQSVIDAQNARDESAKEIEDTYASTIAEVNANLSSGLIDQSEYLTLLAEAEKDRIDSIENANIKLAEAINEAEKKLAEEKFDAQVQYEKELQELREKNLQSTGKLVGGIADQIAPLFGLPPVFGDILNVLTQTPEQIKGTIRALVDSLPELFVRIVENLPVIIEALADAIPELIEKLIEKTPDIIEALVNAAPRIIEKLVLLTPRIAVAMVNAIAKVIGKGFENLLINIGKVAAAIVALPAYIIGAAAQFVAKIADGAVSFVSSILSGATNFIGEILRGAGDFIGAVIQGIADGISGIFSGIGNISLPSLGGTGGGIIGSIVGGVTGAVGSVVSSVGSFLGFAEGGIVPSGYNNDTFPARLTSGELIIPREDVGNLREFLSAQSQGGQLTLSDFKNGLELLGSKLLSGGDKQVTVNLVVGEKELANVILNLNRQGFRMA